MLKCEIYVYSHILLTIYLFIHFKRQLVNLQYCNIFAFYNGVCLLQCLGDQQAALVGQGCMRFGQVKCTFGTGCFLLYNTGNN